MPSRELSTRARASFTYCAARKPTNTNGVRVTAGTCADPSGARASVEPMPDRQHASIGDLPPALKQTLHDCALGEAPANILAMRLLTESRETGEAERALVALLGKLDADLHAIEM